MGQPPIDHDSGLRRDDRLSNLGDVLLGHILSFLNVKEAARAAALSSRWRDIFAFVHTVSLELPERPVYDCDPENSCDHPQLRPFVAAVTAALFSRSRRPAPAPAAVPLRGLRVSTDGYVKNSTVDQWVSYALRHAASEFELDLRFEPDPVCWGPDRFRFAGDVAPAVVRTPDRSHGVDRRPCFGAQPGDGARVGPDKHHDGSEQPPWWSHLHDVNDEDDAASSEDDAASLDEYEMSTPGSWRWNNPQGYTVPRGLFSCAALRSLRLGSCWLSPAATISLPSLEVLRLTSVHDEEDYVQRLISACPRLADLTVESCATVTALFLLDNEHLRRLALRFCPKLSTVSVDASELRSFEYLGTVQDNTFLNVLGPAGGLFPSIASCKIDICTAVTSEEDLLKLGSFLRLFGSTKHLHLSSTLMAWYFTCVPEFSSLRHLEISGCLPSSVRPARVVDPARAIYAMCMILDEAPNLEVLTLFFEAVPADSCCNYSGGGSEGDLLDVHHLHYSKNDIIQQDYVPLDVSEPVPSCLGNRLRKINLVHYQGGRVQRTLARFLLRNAAVLQMLYCGFAEGPQWIQKELMREIQGWVTNETARKEFH